ncbi:hypothetical protein SAMD00019534_118790 [Acytostelium subglobosum LB1]|uniref:hypothetical protein n=1 Tax=Acytostelium subglobosum LB1 TaxID=1410327 RepID=UPI000644D60A|nr:hypothetical protein SAMD00019534_118790 [Acytostelium subglobosum LB1]GAM28703.1 hypothetical protein SAMD00019534_118790 [Acytostelium subglobosum LB1]|eukprot:XP_012748481.1 hypothetical protein SAMD00019534_118790 [Acytostelium subglobosum LB1]
MPSSFLKSRVDCLRALIASPKFSDYVDSIQQYYSHLPSSEEHTLTALELSALILSGYAHTGPSFTFNHCGASTDLVAELTLLRQLHPPSNDNVDMLDLLNYSPMQSQRLQQTLHEFGVKKLRAYRAGGFGRSVPPHFDLAIASDTLTHLCMHIVSIEPAIYEHIITGYGSLLSLDITVTQESGRTFQGESLLPMSMVHHATLKSLRLHCVHYVEHNLERFLNNNALVEHLDIAFAQPLDHQQCPVDNSTLRTLKIHNLSLYCYRWHSILCELSITDTEAFRSDPSCHDTLLSSVNPHREAYVIHCAITDDLASITRSVLDSVCEMHRHLVAFEFKQVTRGEGYPAGAEDGGRKGYTWDSFSSRETTIAGTTGRAPRPQPGSAN